ncbi:class I SAM-dependent methyltransferase [Algoriphagus mannitolivorans]|uniref:class I SAM-dependent methyltransferase n=1 Tax=Algoriphagus mannitolivorans TaxID=226504 RepID=UPI0004055F15|nr:class I SAM-dependent methyltransferase [Algoriphagus mannitolivorans]
MRQVICPVCKTPPNFSHSPYSICDCSTCGVRWTFLPKEIQWEELYRDEVYAVVDNRTSIFEKIIFSEARKVLRQAQSLFPQANRLLDFGSGKGQFLAVANAMGWKGLGIETEAERAKFAREKYGVEVLTSLYSQGKIENGNFDLITLNHVLEHLPAPIELLKQLTNDNLAKGGILYLEVPRADSWQAKIAGNQWMHWDIPKHLSHWTAQSLIDQLKQLGFSKAGIRSFSVHLGVLGMLQALMSLFGFKENLILRLKRKKSVGLLMGIAMLLPFALLLELLSVAFGKSGIMGIYWRKDG